VLQYDEGQEPMLTRFFRQLRWGILLPAALLLGLAPFRPEPHLVEKLRMLMNGQLARPLDIFDLLLHGVPILLVAGKLLLGRDRSPSSDQTG
jgi:hypothetical protein